jgi:protein involved in polysaccharide export with SLBB domain
VNLPKVRGLRLDGRTVSEVEREIAAKLSEAGITGRADVYVSVIRYAPRYVFLVGAVFERIEVSPSGRANLLQILAQAGERMKDVDLRRVTVIPGAGATPRLLDLGAYLARGGASAPELAVDAGDYVSLVRQPPEREAERPRVFVLGGVQKPGAYLYQTESGRPVSLLQLVAYAGGASQYGDLGDVTIRRFDPAHPQGQTYRVDVENILEKNQADVALLANDIVYVGEH